MHFLLNCVPLFLFFFFFKQKTAYEMRISDWSSDVCSSDLDCLGRGRLFLAGTVADVREREGARAVKGHALARRAGSFARLRPDRKSVVEGKSVSVRVDLGGRRIIKKKKAR